jgi:hypothetical protein
MILVGRTKLKSTGKVATVGMFGACAGRGGSGAGPRGLSVFCVDPGETTGWAWACVSYKELQSVGDGSLQWSELFARLRKERDWPLVKGSGSGSGRLSSARLRYGQVDVYRGALSASGPAAQVAMAEAMTVLDLAVEIDQLHLTSSIVSGGSVGWVTDLVIEDFILRERTKSRSLLAPVRLSAGLVQEVLRNEKLIGLSFLSASDSKGAITDERLRNLGLWVPGQQHARDALRLLALWLRSLGVGQ